MTTGVQFTYSDCAIDFHRNLWIVDTAHKILRLFYGQQVQ